VINQFFQCSSEPNLLKPHGNRTKIQVNKPQKTCLLKNDFENGESFKKGISGVKTVTFDQ
jgi:hypothetical protein